MINDISMTLFSVYILKDSLRKRKKDNFLCESHHKSLIFFLFTLSFKHLDSQDHCH
jgi:hypothetical protein